MYKYTHSIDGYKLLPPYKRYNCFHILTTNQRTTTIYTQMNLPDVIDMLTHKKHCLITDECGDYTCIFRKHIVKVREGKQLEEQ